MRSIKSIEQRFWEKIHKTDTCWIWTGARAGVNGYGHFNFDGKTLSAHRYSYEIHVGAIPPGLLVLHKCDVPHCVNPAHLRVGTDADNSRDMAEKGRSSFGEKNGCAKLTENIVRQILADRGKGVSQREISRKYKVS